MLRAPAGISHLLGMFVLSRNDICAIWTCCVPCDGDMWAASERVTMVWPRNHGNGENINNFGKEISFPRFVPKKANHFPLCIIIDIHGCSNRTPCCCWYHRRCCYIAVSFVIVVCSGGESVNSRLLWFGVFLCLPACFYTFLAILWRLQVHKLPQAHDCCTCFCMF